MPNTVDNNVDAFGLRGGAVISGSATIATDGYVYYPLTTCVSNVVVRNLVNRNTLTGSWSAGIPIFGEIISVTQSSGVAIVYSGSRSILI